MSYILDALKRAESERERGVVPGLHSQSVPLRRPVAGSRAVAKPLMLAGAALGLTLLGVLAWRSFGPVAPGGSTPGVAGSPVITSQVIAAIPAVAAVAAVPTAVSVTTAVTPNPAPLAKAIEAAQADKPPALAASPKPEPRPAPVAAVVAKPEPAPPRIVPIGELPADIRQTLPKVVISGSTYSDNPAYRMLIINGEVFREGEKPAPDLQLEQIRAKAAVLNFKGLRYSVAY
jgi:general secretion pathway protein B